MARRELSWLPAEVAADDIVASVGLVSDTHMPERRAALPPALFDALDGVDLVLHAGDVGELWVLDRLSAIAPVVAVHGNDDGAEAQRELPYQQVVVIGGVRLLLCHSHEQDPERERVQRADDAWEPKLDRRTERGRHAGAAVVIYGHTHVPMALEHAGVLLINPGALASPNYLTRQRVQTVAQLVITRDGARHTVHINLPDTGRPDGTVINYDAGFRAALQQVSAPVTAPDLAAFAAAWPRAWAAFSPAARAAARALFLDLGRRCWDGDREPYGRADVEMALSERAGLAPAVRAELVAALGGE